MVEEDYELISFSDGEQVYVHCQQLSLENEAIPDVIFLDLNMPVMDGWDFLDDFLLLTDTRFTDTQVYIVSSSMHQEDLNRAKDYSIVKDYLIKPVAKVDLANLLSGHK